MTLKELLDTINSSRYDDPGNAIEKISIMDDNGEPEVTARISSSLLKAIEGREVDEISALDEDKFGVWLK